MLLIATALVASFAPSRFPVNVYIEDTDAFSIVFYANYLKFWERATVAALGSAKINKLLREDDMLFGVQQAHGMRYSNPAVLGDSCEATIEPLGIDSEGRLAVKAAMVRDGNTRKRASTFFVVR